MPKEYEAWIAADNQDLSLFVLTFDTREKVGGVNERLSREITEQERRRYPSIEELRVDIGREKNWGVLKIAGGTGAILCGVGLITMMGIFNDRVTEIPFFTRLFLAGAATASIAGGSKLIENGINIYRKWGGAKKAFQQTLFTIDSR